MNKHRLILLAAVIIGGTGLTLCSCESVQKYVQAAAPIVVPLSKAAELSGHLPPGSSVLIEKGTAVITSADKTQEEKVVALASLGLEQVLKEKGITPGDTLVVDDAGKNLVKAPEPVPTATATPPQPTGPPENGLLPLPNE